MRLRVLVLKIRFDDSRKIGGGFRKLSIPWVSESNCEAERDRLLFLYGGLLLGRGISDVS
jgi:hypothetical protein